MEKPLRDSLCVKGKREFFRAIELKFVNKFDQVVDFVPFQDKE